MYDILKERIKTHEGFRDFCYLDSLGKKTVGKINYKNVILK